MHLCRIFCILFMRALLGLDGLRSRSWPALSSAWKERPAGYKGVADFWAGCPRDNVPERKRLCV